MADTQMNVGILGMGSIGTRHAANAWELGHHVRSYDPIKDNTVSREDLWQWADKVIVATPTKRHIDDIIHGMACKKPMLVEKPISNGLAPTLTNYVALVGYNLRYHPIIQGIKLALDAGRIGTPLWANIVVGQLSNKPEYMRDGVILNWSHEIDLALHLLGPAQLKSANVRRIDKAAEDIADLQLTHHSGCLSTVHLDYVSNPWIRVGTIVGDKGEIYYDLEAGVLDICGTIEQFQQDAFDTSYKTELRAFLTDQIGHGCTREQATAVLRICLEASSEAA